MNVYRIKKRLAQHSCAVPKPIDLYWTQTGYFVIHLFNQGIVNVSEVLTDPKMAFRKQSVTQLITYHTQKKRERKKHVWGGSPVLRVRTNWKQTHKTKREREKKGDNAEDKIVNALWVLIRSCGIKKKTNNISFYMLMVKLKRQLAYFKDYK